MNSRTWFERLRKTFSGDRYKAWLFASYPKKSLDVSTLKTGDLLMLRTWEPFGDKTTEDWEQVGMVIENPSARLRNAFQLPEGESRFLLIGDIDESNRSKVQLVSLQAYLKSIRDLYGSDLLEVCRKLDLPGRASDQETFPGLENWLLALRGKYYTRSVEQVISRFSSRHSSFAAVLFFPVSSLQPLTRLWG